MSKLIIAGLFAVSIAACGPAGEDACQNIKDACKDNSDISQGFNMGNCVDYFDADEEGRGDERSCVADASDCDDIIACDSGYFD